jgi:hypothetical protein
MASGKTIMACTFTAANGAQVFDTNGRLLGEVPWPINPNGSYNTGGGQVLALSTAESGPQLGTVCTVAIPAKPTVTSRNTDQAAMTVPIYGLQDAYVADGPLPHGGGGPHPLTLTKSCFWATVAWGAAVLGLIGAWASFADAVAGGVLIPADILLLAAANYSYVEATANRIQACQ